MNLIDQVSPLTIINAVGYATRVGGSQPSTEVLEAMRWAQERYFEIDDLLQFASGVVARETGSSGGLVTCSASAALTLGAAAIMARYDLAVMDALPDTHALTRRQFLYSRCNDFDYDHPLRASGAELIPFAFEAEGLEQRLKEAIDKQTAGIVFVWTSTHQQPLIQRIGKFCRTHGIPFLLDAAMGLPPAKNLHEFYQLGPNLVTLSGGKHLEGPQNSGLLFGDSDLITSAWLQMVDMHVQPETWSLARLINEEVVPKPPRHGIGRGFKVGKDAVLGCVAALIAYSKRDFTEEAVRWRKRCEAIVSSLCNSANFQAEVLLENGTGQYPVVRIKADDPARMAFLKRQLKQGTPKIITAEDDDDQRLTYLYPMCLLDDEIPVLVRRINELIAP